MRMGWGGEDERPPPGRLAAPGTMSCRATFLVFLIHQGVDAGLLWHFLGGTRGCEPPPSSRSECSRRLLCPAGSRGPRAHAGRGCGVSLRHGGAADVPRGNVSGPKVKSEGADVPGSDSRCLRVLHVGPRWGRLARTVSGPPCRRGVPPGCSGDVRKRRRASCVAGTGVPQHPGVGGGRRRPWRQGPQDWESGPTHGDAVCVRLGLLCGALQMGCGSSQLVGERVGTNALLG